MYKVDLKSPYRLEGMTSLDFRPNTNKLLLHGQQLVILIQSLEWLLSGLKYFRRGHESTSRAGLSQ